jgi:hypothetical protein
MCTRCFLRVAAHLVVNGVCVEMPLCRLDAMNTARVSRGLLRWLT